MAAGNGCKRAKYPIADGRARGRYLTAPGRGTGANRPRAREPNFVSAGEKTLVYIAFTTARIFWEFAIAPLATVKVTGVPPARAVLR